MGWFEHRHWWIEKLKAKTTEKGVLIVEDCRCGAVRTIEVYSGVPPVVRIAKPSETE